MQPVALKILTNTLRRKHEEKSRSIIDGNYDGSILHYRMRKQQKEATSDKAAKTEKEADTESDKDADKKPQIRLQH